MASTPRLDKLDKNYFINGNFDFWQRGTTTAVSNTYLADRWKVVSTGVSTYSQQAGGPNTMSQYFARVAVASSVCTIQQRVESIHTRYITDANMTVSFWARASAGTPSLTLAVQVPTVVDNYAAVNTVVNVVIGTLSTNWQKFSYTFAVTPTMQSNGFLVDFGNNLGVGALTLDFAQCMLNEGSFASNFALAGKNWQDEYLMCLRYYEKSLQLTETPGVGDGTGAIRERAYVGGYILGRARFQVTKRVVPSLATYNPAVASNSQWRNIDSATNMAVNSLVATTQQILVEGTAATTNQSYMIHWSADAEL